MTGFGDTVRIRATGETESLGLAGCRGTVTGFTTPSATGVAVIGSTADDHAVAVQLDDRPDDLWFAAGLLEFVDHGAGKEITIDGVDVKLIRDADGSWREEAFDNPRKRPKPWWRLW